MQAAKSISLSDAVNELAEAGLARGTERKRFVLPEFDYRPATDLTNIGDVLGMLEEEAWSNSHDR